MGGPKSVHLSCVGCSCCSSISSGIPEPGSNSAAQCVTDRPSIRNLSGLCVLYTPCQSYKKAMFLCTVHTKWDNSVYITQSSCVLCTQKLDKLYTELYTQTGPVVHRPVHKRWTSCTQICTHSPVRVYTDLYTQSCPSVYRSLCTLYTRLCLGCTRTVLTMGSSCAQNCIGFVHTFG